MCEGVGSHKVVRPSCDVFSQCLVLENIKIFSPHPLALGKRKLNAVSACMYTFTTKVSWKLNHKYFVFLLVCNCEEIVVVMVLLFVFLENRNPFSKILA